jgi:hypothetical protein
MAHTERVVQWFLRLNGNVEGPFAEDVIVARVRAGMVQGELRPATADDTFPWLPLASHPPFAAALQEALRTSDKSHQQVVSPSQVSPRAALSVDAVALLVMFVAVGGVAAGYVARSISEDETTVPVRTAAAVSSASSSPSLHPPTDPVYQSPKSVGLVHEAAPWRILGTDTSVNLSPRDPPWKYLGPGDVGEVVPEGHGPWRCRYGPTNFYKSEPGLSGPAASRDLRCSSDGWRTWIEGTAWYRINSGTGAGYDSEEVIMDLQVFDGVRQYFRLQPVLPK